ncbi:hypothetical protein N7478_008060 [Penicillium angulare]|uniref:uncharacterized protein n=1 Tax=Penicillium angulare TaxID=116970 RepID=UPI002540E501|nr:uncharacterized protein N7478_008060 [Penicillium angulare]KAJ5272935.1 hypothetical protein N7478_008060 [Penicillium angulare]
MQFKLSIITALFAVSAIASPVPSTQTSCASVAVSALNGLTSQVTDLNSALAGKEDPVALANAIIAGFASDILTILITGLSLPCDSTLTRQNQEDICDAASSFIKEDKTLVSTLSSKRTVLSDTIWLSAVEGAISGLASATNGYINPIIDSAPVCGGTLESELNSLVDAINEAVGAY